MPYTTFDPTWKKYEPGVHSEDTKTQIEETDKFLAERDHELKTNPAAKRWEESRKKEWDRNKPHATKERLKIENAEQLKFAAGLRVGGEFNQLLHPVPGFLIVELETPPDKTTSGIYIAPEVSEVMRNTGIVLDVGDSTKELDAPCQPGDKIMFKKGAGLELGIEGRDCRFMIFSDVLGVFHD